MDGEARYPLLTALCAFMLCFVFAGNIVYASESKMKFYLDMSEITQDDKFRGYIHVYNSEYDYSSKSLTRVYPGDVRLVDVEQDEWIAVNLALVSTLFRCKSPAGEHRMRIGQGNLAQSVIITPRLLVQAGVTVCELGFVSALEE